MFKVGRSPPSAGLERCRAVRGSGDTKRLWPRNPCELPKEGSNAPERSREHTTTGQYSAVYDQEYAQGSKTNSDHCLRRRNPRIFQSLILAQKTAPGLLGIDLHLGQLKAVLEFPLNWVTKQCLAEYLHCAEPVLVIKVKRPIGRLVHLLATGQFWTYPRSPSYVSAWVVIKRSDSGFFIDELTAAET